MDIRAHKEIRAAIRRGDASSALSLLQEDPTRLTMDTPFGSWLHVAASFGMLDLVKALIALGMDPNAYGGTFGGNSLNEACSDGKYEVAKYLIENGATLDVSEPERNPLFGTIVSGHTEIAKLLIDSGIDISVKYTGKTMKGWDAREFARQWGRSEIIEMIDAKRNS